MNTPETIEMRNLTTAEIDEASGGFLWGLVAVVAVVAAGLRLLELTDIYGK